MIFINNTHLFKVQVLIRKQKKQKKKNLVLNHWLLV